MQAYYITYKISGCEYSTHVDAKNAISAKNKIARKNKVAPASVEIVNVRIIGYY